MLKFKCQATTGASARPCPGANYAGDVVESVTGETGFLRLASYDPSSQPFEGYLDELRVYGRVLDSSAVSKQVFSKLVPADEAGLRSSAGGVKWGWRAARSSHNRSVNRPSPIHFSACCVRQVDLHCNVDERPSIDSRNSKSPFVPPT